VDVPADHDLVMDDAHTHDLDTTDAGSERPRSLTIDARRREVAESGLRGSRAERGLEPVLDLTVIGAALARPKGVRTWRFQTS
jgi:hypothetical protein